MAEGFRWQLRLTRAAEDDYRNILRWTLEQFGEAQARLYAETLTRTIESLAAGPEVAGSRRRNEIAQGLMTLHVARAGRKGRHFVLYRVSPQKEQPAIDVLRLLHDSMDLVRHVETGNEGIP